SASQALVTDLKNIAGNDNVSNTQAVREQHGRDESYHKVPMHHWEVSLKLILLNFVSLLCCQIGMCSTSASGTQAVRYGTMRENVINMEVVMADGNIIKTAGLKGRSRKTSAGYNLTNLFVGNEGTLGIITETTLRLHAVPEAILAAVSPFKDFRSAVDATVDVMQSGLPVARIEFLDETMIDACNKFSKLNLDVAATLFLEFHGTKDNIDAQGIAAEEICKSFGCLKFAFSSELEKRNELWKARHNAAYAAQAMKADSKMYSTDVCVPISQLPEMIVYAKKELERLKLLGPIVGHVGDGNFHVILVFDPKSNEVTERVHEFSKNLAKYYKFDILISNCHM
ncbi:unnamed protein product, partial [Didymodactylos carnosus]